MTSSRRTPLALLVAILVATGVLSPSPGTPAASDVAPPERPNIVVITTDDQTLADLQWMPRTRRQIGDAGTAFTDFVAPQPLCCPSRAQLLTGQYAQNNGVRSNNGRWGGYDNFRPGTALPVWLQEAGYTTGFVGKYLNGYPGTGGPETGWDEWDATVGRVYDYVDYGQYDGTRTTVREEYHTTYVADRTVDLVDRLSAADEPFFVWSSYVAPHGICLPAQEIPCQKPPLVEDRFADVRAHVRAPFLDDPGFNTPIKHGVHRPAHGNGRVERAEKVRLFRQRIRALASVDHGIARTVAALRDAGELANTVVLFTSDNGYLFGEHRYSGKILAYEQAVRVPLLVRGPGVSVGALAPGTAAMIDLAPTIAELAGARPLVPVDGRSLVRDLTGHARDRDRTLLVQAGLLGPDTANRGWKYRGVRTGRYTYVRWVPHGAIELFDRRRDPFELVNVARDPAYRDVRRELARRTRILGACSGASCRRSFGALPRPRSGVSLTPGWMSASLRWCDGQAPAPRRTGRLPA